MRKVTLAIADKNLADSVKDTEAIMGVSTRNTNPMPVPVSAFSNARAFNRTFFPDFEYETEDTSEVVGVCWAECDSMHPSC